MQVPPPSFRKDPAFRQWLKLALEEDIGTGDITSQLLFPSGLQAQLLFCNREPMVAAGLWLIEEVREMTAATAHLSLLVQEGAYLPHPTTLAEVRGEARLLLAAERLILNLLQRMSGVATLTRRYVEALHGTGVDLLDTRKTMPGMRLLDKYAVTCGGGKNHRMRLDDRILIKDNHIAICGGVTPAIALAKAGNVKGLILEVECDTLPQVREAAEAGVDWILLDNMPPTMLREAVSIVAGRAKLEASGGITLATLRSIAETGINAISSGALTHSAPAIDIGLDIILHKVK